jgi:dipeptidyl aminopeptidase/acylaminoacyl peptidase
MFAANGYAVLAVNYRGSAGRGQKFSRAIFADWGNYEVQDLLAGVDHVIKMGVADPDRLGVGGWSYGGILTDYLIASDNRFKAATSGAGTAFTVAFYGTDQYIIQYDYRDRTALESESLGDVPEDLVSVPACRSHSDADALSRRRTRFQRACAG